MRGLEYYLHDMMHNTAGDGQDQQAKGDDDPDWRVWCYWLAHYKKYVGLVQLRRACVRGVLSEKEKLLVGWSAHTRRELYHVVPPWINKRTRVTSCATLCYSMAKKNWAKGFTDETRQLKVKIQNRLPRSVRTWYGRRVPIWRWSQLRRLVILSFSSEVEEINVVEWFIVPLRHSLSLSLVLLVVSLLAPNQRSFLFLQLIFFFSLSLQASTATIRH